MKDSAYYRRLGGLVVEHIDPEMRMSRAMQICATWRSHFAWHLVTALRVLGTGTIARDVSDMRRSMSPSKQAKSRR